MTTRKCPGYVKTGNGMDACILCYRGQEHRPAPSRKERTCQGCGNKDSRGWLDCVKCGGPMKLPGEMGRACIGCGRMFRPLSGQHVRCSGCTTSEALRSRSKRAKERIKAEAAAIKREADPRLPCPRCVHGKRSDVSDLGWECAAMVAGRCGPLGVARLFVRREDG